MTSQSDQVARRPSPSPPRPTGRRPISFLARGTAFLALAVVVALGSQLLAGLGRTVPSAAPAAPVADGLGGITTTGPGVADLDVGSGSATAGAADTDRIRANVTFWSDRLTAHPTDFVAAQKLGESQIELARATGDLSAYLAAEAAFGTALRLVPDLPAALAYRGVVLVSLHRFGEAGALARSVLAESPDDPTALATLGDAGLELGDLAGARSAYDRLAVVAPSAAASVRLGHLAFVAGDPVGAVRFARGAVAQADEEELEGERAGFYRYQLADTLLATGDRTGAEAAYRDALARDPRSFLAHAGLGRALAADGRLDDAIQELSAAIAIVPQPDALARRADLYRLRNGAGDATRADHDGQTVLAIARLAGAAGSVYDRTLALYLANHGQDAQRAVDLATAEIAVRKDVYGYDALAWSLLAAGRASDADAAMQTSLAVGTKDARLLYHAGMIAAALGDTGRARTQLAAALELDPSFDALQAERARSTLAGL